MYLLILGPPRGHSALQAPASPHMHAYRLMGQAWQRAWSTSGMLRMWVMDDHT